MVVSRRVFVVTGQLHPKEHTVLRILSDPAQRADVGKFIMASRVYVMIGDFQRVDAFLQASVRELGIIPTHAQVGL